MNRTLSNTPSFEKKSTMKHVTPSLGARATTPRRNKARLSMAALESGLQYLKPVLLSAGRLLWALVVGLVFATSASAQTIENKEVMPKLADWVYRKPPKDVPLRVGVVPDEAVAKANNTICNRIWIDQGGSYERPFALTYASQHDVSKTIFFPGIFALDNYILLTPNGFTRETLAKYMGKGDRGFVNAAEEAVLLIDDDGESHKGNFSFALYLKRISSGKCAKESTSECKRFEAQAELYQFNRGYYANFLRKEDLGKVHIESVCVGQRYLYHREPFLSPGPIDRLERWLQRLRKD
jgi:hypothetical protein